MLSLISFMTLVRPERLSDQGVANLPGGTTIPSSVSHFLSVGTVWRASGWA